MYILPFQFYHFHMKQEENLQFQVGLSLSDMIRMQTLMLKLWHTKWLWKCAWGTEVPALGWENPGDLWKGETTMEAGGCSPIESAHKAAILPRRNDPWLLETNYNYRISLGPTWKLATLFMLLCFIVLCKALTDFFFLTAQGGFFEIITATVAPLC